MLQTLKRLFAKSFRKPTEELGEIDESDANPSENPKFIVTKRQIVRLLSEIDKTSPLCTVTLSDNSQYSSSILGIDADQYKITLDELLPRVGNQLILPHTPVKVSALHKGIHLSFQLDNLRAGQDQGITYFTATLPDRVYYPQRRTSPRVSIDSKHIAFSGYHEASQQTVSGQLYDLSRSGAGVEISKHRVRLHPGDMLTNCKIELNNHALEFTLHVRFVKTNPSNTSKTQVGGNIQNLSSRSEHKLSHFIASLERIQLRKQKAH